MNRKQASYAIIILVAATLAFGMFTILSNREAYPRFDRTWVYTPDGEAIDAIDVYSHDIGIDELAPLAIIDICFICALAYFATHSDKC